MESLKNLLLGWLARCLPQSLVMAVLLRQVAPSEVHRIALRKVVDETSRAHFSADSLALPALEPKREDALRRIRRLFPAERDRDLILGLELSLRRKGE